MSTDITITITITDIITITNNSVVYVKTLSNCDRLYQVMMCLRLYHTFAKQTYNGECK